MINLELSGPGEYQCRGGGIYYVFEFQDEGGKKWATKNRVHEWLSDGTYCADGVLVDAPRRGDLIAKVEREGDKSDLGYDQLLADVVKSMMSGSLEYLGRLDSKINDKKIARDIVSFAKSIAEAIRGK